jgi:hypothetical protein
MNLALRFINVCHLLQTRTSLWERFQWRDALWRGGANPVRLKKTPFEVPIRAT